MTGLSICVVGGTGSFGSALVRRLLTMGPNRVVILSRGEHRQADLRRTLGDDPRIRWFIGDVRDEARLRQAFYGCDVVINAAAIKRIEVASREAEEAIKTNVLGMGNVLRAATAEGVERVLLISSDKACEPVTCYGATKLMAEHLTTSANVFGFPRGTRSASVRWGNVLGSAGSVVHTFRRAIRDGRPVQITDSRMTRFWIGMDDAVDFCPRVVEEMRGGEVFVPKLLASPILDLFRSMVGGVTDLLGWEEVGLRAGGEKIHEILVSADETPRAVDIGWGYVIEPTWNAPATRAPWTGEPLKEAIRSDTVEWMGIDELRRAVAAVPEE